jgi:hypothetical protein
MKRFFLGIATLVALTFSVASSAFTLDEFSGNPGDSIYNDTGAKFVSLTDFSQDPQSAPMIEMSADILSIYQHDYIIGIFDAVTHVELNVLDTFLGDVSSNVLFSGGSATSDIDSAAVGYTFGFFIRFYEDIGGGVISSEEYYSDDTVEDMFSIFYSPFGIASTNFSEVALGVGVPGSNGTAGVSLVAMNDVVPVATPLPAAVWLFGPALIGLLGLGRRRAATTGASA